jgi:hypothetical protein
MVVGPFEGRGSNKEEERGSNKEEERGSNKEEEERERGVRVARREGRSGPVGVFLLRR